MTNAETAKHFASLPADEEAKILLINGDTSIAEPLFIDPPGTNLDEVDNLDDIADDDKKLATAFEKW